MTWGGMIATDPILGGWAPRTRKWLGSPLIIRQEVRPFVRGPTLPDPQGTKTNHGYEPLTKILFRMLSKFHAKTHHGTLLASYIPEYWKHA